MFDPQSSFNSWRLFQLEKFFNGSLLAMGIVQNEPELVRQGLYDGESPNTRYCYEEDNDSITIPNSVHTITPIVQAAVVGSLPITKLLVEYGADVNLCQKNGESALANAANRGDVELVSYLLEHGADPNLRKPFGTPLAFAKGAAVMGVLLDHGADPNIPDEDGDLPVIGSIDSNSLDEVELLINYGTDMNHRNKQGETPLDRARRRGNYDPIADLLQTAKQRNTVSCPVSECEAASPHKLPALSAACAAGDFNEAVFLLRNGADPNEKSADGRTPLFYCSEVAFVCLLEHFGADVNAIDASGNTPIVSFLTSGNARHNSERAIIFLIEAGADVDAKNEEGLSAREIANSVKEFEIRAAFAQGLELADRKRRSYEDMLAKQRNDWAEWNAECKPFEPTDDWEQTMANCFNACVLSDLDVLKANEDFVRDNLSVKMGSESTNWRSMLMMACTDASVEVVNYLIALGADVDQLDNTGQTALRYAAISWRDAAEKIEALINAGADVNHRSDDGSTALSDAAYEQNIAAAKALIARGADVDNRDIQGYTAISWACGKGIPEADIVELLLRAGADVRDLYEMGCVLQYVDYEGNDRYGRSKESFLRPQDIQERFLYEHSIVPVRLASH